MERALWRTSVRLRVPLRPSFDLGYGGADVGWFCCLPIFCEPAVGERCNSDFLAPVPTIRGFFFWLRIWLLGNQFVRLAQHLAGRRIDHVDPFANDAVYRSVQVIVRCLFWAEALDVKTGERTSVYECRHARPMSV